MQRAAAASQLESGGGVRGEESAEAEPRLSDEPVQHVEGWPAGMDEAGAARRARARQALHVPRAERLPGMAELLRELQAEERGGDEQ